MTERAVARSAAPAVGLPCQACAAIVGAASRPVPTHLQAQRGTEFGARVSYGWVIFLCYQQRPLCRAQALLLRGLDRQSWSAQAMGARTCRTRGAIWTPCHRGVVPPGAPPPSPGPHTTHQRIFRKVVVAIRKYDMYT